MKYYIGIDIGGTNLRAAVLDENYRLLNKFKIENEVEKGPEYNIDKLIVGIIKRGWDKKVTSIGVGCPGPLDIKTGTILVTPNLRKWDDFKLKKYLEDKFKLPVVVNNDANVAGYSEAMIGAGKGAESVYYMTLSTGVGGGFIYKGEIVSGFNSVTAEIGNMIINEDTYKHSNMNYGGLEGQCSGVGISRIASDILGKELTTKDVFEGAKNGDKQLQQVLSNWVINVAKAIANIIVTVDPQVIVLGGSVIINNPSYLRDIQEEVKKRVYDGVNVNIKLVEIGDDTGLIGAGILAINIDD